MLTFMAAVGKRKHLLALGVHQFHTGKFSGANFPKCCPDEHYTSYLIYSLVAYNINEHVLNLSYFLMEIVNSIIIIIYLSLLFLSA